MNLTIMAVPYSEIASIPIDLASIAILVLLYDQSEFSIRFKRSENSMISYVFSENSRRKYFSRYCDISDAPSTIGSAIEFATDLEEDEIFRIKVFAI